MSEIKTICVHLGKSGRVDPAFKELARATGEFIAKQGWKLVFGGAKIGTMGILADGAMQAGGHVTGVIPEFLNSVEPFHGELSELIVVKSMHERKKIMADMADAFVTLPGGLGTLEELAEVLTWRQILLHDKPVVLMNCNNFWGPFVDLLEHFKNTHYMLPEHMTLFKIIEKIEDLPLALSNNQPDRRNHYSQWI